VPVSYLGVDAMQSLPWCIYAWETPQNKELSGTGEEPEETIDWLGGLEPHG